jgi:hypothetical protein
VSIRGVDAQRLLAEVLLRLEPLLPAGVRVELTSHSKWTTLQRVTDESVFIGPVSVSTGANGKSIQAHTTSVPALGAWIPLLPRKLSARLTARNAVETVLDVAYQLSPGEKEPDFAVQARAEGEWILVSYLRSEGQDPVRRVAIEPLPLALCLPSRSR